MKRVRLDAAPGAVKEFVSGLEVGHDGVELGLDGRVLCRIVPCSQLFEVEKKALIEDRWRLIRQAQQRNQGAPARVIEREIHEAVEEVRQKHRQ